MSTLKLKPPKTFLTRIKERVRLNPGSEKQTYHIVLDLEGEDLDYSVGDCVGVYPENDPHYVDALIEAIGDSSLHDFLLKKANLNRISKKILGEYPDFLTLLRHKKVESGELREKLRPLLPRYYSIASSQSQVGNEVHLIVALSKNAPQHPTLYGTCSHYLCHRAPLLKRIIPLFIQPSHNFSLPPKSPNQPIIMIGPGTGVAPFRGFLQERRHHKNWLFFGERNEKTDFYYRPFWESLVLEKRLKIDYAFSRDQKEKIYVQHKMLENSAQLWQWLEEGAYLFVCGDASRMAKDVDKTLHQIVTNEGMMDFLDAKKYIKHLRNTNRYQRDVY